MENYTCERLPRFLVFYSKRAGKYINYGLGGDSRFTKVVWVKSGNASNPLSKFEVVPSEDHSSMVHLRSCFNNKYLRRPMNDFLIVAAADKPEEDQTLWSSTLFQPVFVVDQPSCTVRLLHVQSGRYAEWFNSATAVSAEFSMSLWLSSSFSPNAKNMFEAIDWESLVTLPRRVAFLDGDRNYFALVDPKETGALVRFWNKYAEVVKNFVNEIVPLSDGTFRIKNCSLGAFWRLDSNTYCIYADDKSISAPTRESLFAAVKVSGDNIALLNLGNNNFCTRDSSTILFRTGGALKANESEITQNAHLVLMELVASRSITDIKFHLSDGWVYNEAANVVLHQGQYLINDTTTPQTLSVNISYSDIKTGTWNSTIQSYKLGPKFKINPKESPFVTDSTSIQVTPPFEPSYVWGETTTTKSKAVISHTVVLQPMTKVTLKILATSVTCDVPFTYTRYELLDEKTGQEEFRIMDDGMYTGTNYINVMVDVSPPEPAYSVPTTC